MSKWEVITILCLAAALVGAACGGGGGELTVQGYFREVRVIVDEYREERDEVLMEQVARDADIDTPGTLDAYLPPLRKMVGALQDLDPPTDVDAAHREAVGALGIFLEANEELVARLSDADSDDERWELLSEPPPPELDPARLDSACIELQDIADDSDIALDLDCEFGFLKTRLFLFMGASMEPTFSDGTLVEHSDYGDASPKLGDIVVFRSPTNPDREFMKRIIGGPGDVLEIDPATGEVTVNDQVIDEPYLGSKTTCRTSCLWVVPEGSYFVMGDNRGNSSDSRQDWFLPVENILGRVAE
jgi:signal peptidase I